MGLKFRDLNPLIFDRRRAPGKQCTGIISRGTFIKLGLSKEFVDREFKSIRVVDGRGEVFIEGDFVRLNREKLEIWLSSELNVVRPADATIKGEGEVMVRGTKYTGKVFDASGWKGKAKWVKAMEYVTEPLNLDEILVTLDPRNPAGFGWIVPLPDKALVGALSLGDPRPFVPAVEKRRLSVHGGGIPRVKPIQLSVPAIGDRTGLIKTFTGGGIFGIAELLQNFSNSRKIKKEIERQYLLTEILQRTWRIDLLALRLLHGRTIRVDREFDFHTFLFSLRRL
ncbi:NAD(P)/FAD-dependent oxidoreductase [Metallosphaera tengchongensis]|uniref:NAD(P)/FAD-dependent oxidoreductase n=1 Tax=Metallosphaera tengchongensis TaxID=1532350 RepID=A0A6N0NXM8_9CREN|nr:NAD(P)/FAD-dependent oxidoreductase [Metallosphaera tengchongensis]